MNYGQYFSQSVKENNYYDKIEFENKELKNYRSNAHKRIEDQSKLIKTAKDTLQNVRYEFYKYKSQYNEENFQALQEENENLNVKYEKLNELYYKEKKELEDKCTRYLEKLSHYKIKAEELLSQEKISKDTFRSLDYTIQVTQSYKEELNDLSDKYDLIVKENTKLNKENVELKKSYHDMKIEMYKNNEFVHQEHNKSQVMNNNAEETMNNYRNLENELERTRQSLVNKENDLSQSKIQIDNLKIQITDLSKKEYELDETRLTLRKKDIELTKSLELMDEMNSKLSDLADDNHQLYEKYKNSSEELKHYKENPSKIKNQIKNYQDLIGKQRKNNSDIKKELDSIITQVYFMMKTIEKGQLVGESDYEDFTHYIQNKSNYDIDYAIKYLRISFIVFGKILSLKFNLKLNSIITKMSNQFENITNKIFKIDNLFQIIVLEKLNKSFRQNRIEKDKYLDTTNNSIKTNKSIKIKRNSDRKEEFYTARSNTRNDTYRRMESDDLNTIKIDITNYNPLPKMKQLKYKQSEFQMQSSQLKDSLDFLIKNTNSIVTEISESNKMTEYLQNVKDSNVYYLDHLNKLYVYSNNIIISIENNIKD